MNKLMVLFAATMSFLLFMNMGAEAEQRLQGTYVIQQKSSGRYMDAHENESNDFRAVTRCLSDLRDIAQKFTTVHYFASKINTVKSIN